MARLHPKRRVLIIVQNLPVPFDRRVWLEATTLAQHGYTVSVISPKAKGFHRSRECLEGVEIYRYILPINSDGILGYLAEAVWCFAAAAVLSVRVALIGRGFDILHVCNPPETYWPLALFWRVFGKVFLFDHHDLSAEMAMVKFRRSSGLLISALLLLEKLTYRVAQVVVATNDSHKQIAIGRHGKPPEKVYVVRSGPDLGRFRRYPPDPSFKRGKPYLLAYLGEICSQDGVDYLIRSIRILRVELGRDDFHCVLVGGGPYQPTIVQYAKDQSVDELCTFTGRISDEDLCRVLSSADLAIDPDPKNAWSDASTMNKIMEYMYFGLPIVGFDLRETRISAADAAVLVEPNREEEMARAISRLLDDPLRRRNMGEFARARVETSLAWKYSVESLLAAYNAAWRLRAASSATRSRYTMAKRL
jgi:glycosyltransferase involved in cell wall biosynthesis